jgi:hypothetical protein
LFATGVADTGGKFASGVVDTGGKFSPVSTTPAELVAKFATGVVDKLILVVHFDLQIFPQIFEKI